MPAPHTSPGAYLPFPVVPFIYTSYTCRSACLGLGTLQVFPILYQEDVLFWEEGGEFAVFYLPGGGGGACLLPSLPFV